MGGIRHADVQGDLLPLARISCIDLHAGKLLRAITCRVDKKSLAVRKMTASDF